MSYLIDICILSKARKVGSHSEKLRQWLDRYPETTYYISAVSIGEIQAGISKLQSQERTKKTVFENWLFNELIPRFEQRILGIDIYTCTIWGHIRGEAQKKGINIPVIDALIAASAIQHQLILVTENTKDFLATGVRLLNPFCSSSH